MPYIGTSPSNGVRRKHTYTATASQTSFSGAGAEGATLSYNDSNFVDVYQNGVKLSEADYTSTSGTAIVLATGATVSDIVEVVVYDVFSVADTVSKSAGGTFDGNITAAGTITVTGNADLNGDLDVDGTTNLDVVDIDGAVDMASTLIVKGGDGVTVQTSSDTFLQLKTTGTTANNYIEFKDSGGSAGNFQYNHASNYLATKVNGAEAMRISSIGAVTKPLQPAFNVKTTSTVANISSGALTAITFGSERFDNNSDFSSNTFTAPVTGKYQLNLSIYMLNLQQAVGYYEGQIITSNITYYSIFDPDFGQDNVFYHLSMSVLADMDANDTASTGIYQSSGGNASTDISANSYFTGHLVC